MGEQISDRHNPSRQLAVNEDGSINIIQYSSTGSLIDPATEDKQDDIITNIEKLIGFNISPFDYIALTYVAVGNGAGEIETAIFKTGGASGTTVATLTLTYDASDRLSTVTKT